MVMSQLLGIVDAIARNDTENGIFIVILHLSFLIFLTIIELILAVIFIVISAASLIFVVDM